MYVRQRAAIRFPTLHPAEGRRMRLVRHFLLALVAGLFWAVPLGAQETGAVTGKVVDASTQQPLGNVEVAVAGTPHRELSRADGSFTLNGIPAGSYRLRASRIGYGSQIQEITVTPSSRLSILIKSRTASFETASRPMVGSSRNRRRGPCNNAAARSLRMRCPRESWRTGISRRSWSCKISVRRALFFRNTAAGIR